jgi:hypothetical protein
MPNWCENRLYLEHDDNSKLGEIVKSFKKGELFSYVAPQPTDLHHNEVLQWRRKEWGTKWDVGNEESDGDICSFDVDWNYAEFRFDTAWNPPIPIYQKLFQQGFDVKAYYQEPANCFAGKFEDGEQYLWEDLPFDVIEEFRE